MSVFWLKVLIGVMLVAILAVATVPLLVLISLAGDGTGYGLCEGGLGVCRIPYTAGPELAAGLVIVLFGLIALVRVTMRMVRRLDRRRLHQEQARQVTLRR